MPAVVLQQSCCCSCHVECLLVVQIIITAVMHISVFMYVQNFFITLATFCHYTLHMAVVFANMIHRKVQTEIQSQFDCMKVLRYCMLGYYHFLMVISAFLTHLYYNSFIGATVSTFKRMPSCSRKSLPCPVNVQPKNSYSHEQIMLGSRTGLSSYLSTSKHWPCSFFVPWKQVWIPVMKSWRCQRQNPLHYGLKKSKLVFKSEFCFVSIHSLRDNKISPQGCEVIEDGVKHCTKLEYLK